MSEGDTDVLRCDCCGEVRLWPPLGGLDMGFLAGKPCLSRTCFAHGGCGGRYRRLEGADLQAAHLQSALPALPPER